jgi:hypothetical protein
LPGHSNSGLAGCGRDGRAANAGNIELDFREQRPRPATAQIQQLATTLANGVAPTTGAGQRRGARLLAPASAAAARARSPTGTNASC